MEVNIKIVKRSTQKIKDFEERQWKISDEEHWGKTFPDFKKEKFKFVAYGDSK